jgi:hypothetical protein
VLSSIVRLVALLEQLLRRFGVRLHADLEAMSDAALLGHVQTQAGITGRPGPGLELLADRDIRDPDHLRCIADLFRRYGDSRAASMFDVQSARAFQVRGDVASAAAVLEASVIADPTSIDVQVEHALILKSVGRTHDAAAAYETASALYALRGDPRAEALLKRASQIRANEDDVPSGLGSATPAAGLVDDESTIVAPQEWLDQTVVLKNVDFDRTLVTPPPIDFAPSSPARTLQRDLSARAARRRRQHVRR